MKDKELRKLIGSRAKQRRLELNLTQPYVAEKMGVTASTILRYENGSIDNTKKMVVVLSLKPSSFFSCRQTGMIPETGYIALTSTAVNLLKKHLPFY